MLFQSIKGYATLKRDLCGAVKRGKIPSAQLFLGAPGGVSLSLALSTITYLHCLQRKELDACGVCKSCLNIEKLMHSDLHFLFPIAGIGQVKNKEEHIAASLALWRSLVEENPYSTLEDWGQSLGDKARTIQIGREQVNNMRKIISQSPFESTCKTILVWLPEQLHPVAANAMLKIVEEPTPNTFFFFVSMDAHQVLPTLRSRMCSILVPPLDSEAMQLSLEEAYPTKTTEQLTEVVRIAQGNLNLAKKILEESSQGYFEHFATWIRQLYAQRLGDVVDVANTFHGYSPQVQKNWVAYAIQCLRGALLMKFDSRQALNFAEGELAFMRKFGGVIAVETIEQIIMELCQLTKVLQRNANAKLAFVNSSLHIAKLFLSK